MMCHVTLTSHLIFYLDPNLENDDDMEEDEQQVTYQENEDGDLHYNSVDSMWENARFVLRVTQEQSLTYDGIEKFCDSVQDFTETLYEQMAHQMKEKLLDLRGSTIDESTTQDLLSVFQPTDLFTGLKTRYSREQYYERHFNYQVA